MSAAPTTRPLWQRPAALGAWLLVLAWLAMILLLSSEEFSAAATGGVLLPFLGWLLPGWSELEVWRLHTVIRKLAHVSVYGVLALLAFRAIRLSLAAAALRHAGLALVLVLAAAATDEYHQSLTKVRTGSLGDVGYDLVGGLAALAVLLAWQRLRGGVRPRPARL